MKHFAAKFFTTTRNTHDGPLWVLLAALYAVVCLAAPTALADASEALVADSPTVRLQPLTAEAASNQVNEFHGELLKAMRSDADFATRVEVLHPAIESILDVPSIARICLGRTWRELSVPDKAQFTAALGDLITATYADRFDSFNEQRFVTDSAVLAKGGVVVKTRLYRASGEPVHLDYYFRRGKVFNVVADGVSDLSLRRADYNAIVKDQGYASLLVHMQQQREKLGQDL